MKVENNTSENTVEIFSYENESGETLWTPNMILAYARAEHYNSDVSVEVYDVPPVN